MGDGRGEGTTGRSLAAVDWNRWFMVGFPVWEVCGEALTLGAVCAVVVRLSDTRFTTGDGVKP